MFLWASGRGGEGLWAMGNGLLAGWIERLWAVGSGLLAERLWAVSYGLLANDLSVMIIAR